MLGADRVLAKDMRFDGGQSLLLERHADFSNNSILPIWVESLASGLRRNAESFHCCRSSSFVLSKLACALHAICGHLCH